MALMRPFAASRKGRYGDVVARDATGKYIGIRWAEGGREEMLAVIEEIDHAFEEAA